MGDKSYWIEADQKGNFSNDGKDTFDPQKNYIGIRLQQGVPLLDRDWNELEDIRRYQEMTLRRSYLGDGTPDDGFKISACDPPENNDFKISIGRCLIDGFEAINMPGSKDDFIVFSKQESPQPIEPADPNHRRYDSVHLDLWIEEIIPINDLDPLKNPQDIKMCTSIRHKVRWCIIVDTGNNGLKKQNGHHYYKLAEINRLPRGIHNEDIKDFRSKWQSLEGTEKRFRGIIKSLLRGDIPSEPAISLTDAGIELIQLEEDSQKNAYLFFNKGTRTDFMARVYDKWQDPKPLPLPKQLTKEDAVTFADTTGNMWLFWTEKDETLPGHATIPKTRIHSLRFSSGTIVSSKVEEVVNGVNIILLNVISDSMSNIWAFWLKDMELSYRIWSYKSGKWENQPPAITTLTSSTTIKDDEKQHVLRDDNGTIYLFWIASDNNIYQIKCPRNGSWGKAGPISQQSTDQKSNLQVEVDNDGNIWIFWKQDGKGTLKQNYIYTMKWDPTKDKPENAINVCSILGNVNTSKIARDGKGRVWLFWEPTSLGGINSKNSENWSSTSDVLEEDHTGIYDVFIDAQNVLWVLFQKEASKNIWCKRFINGEWMNEMRLLSDETPKNLIAMLNGQNGDNWLFWRDQNIKNSTDVSGSIWCKRFYGAL